MVDCVWMGSCSGFSIPCLWVGAYSAVEAGSSVAVVSVVTVVGLVVDPVNFVHAQHSHTNMFCQASLSLCQHRVRISESFSMSLLARRTAIGVFSVYSWCSMAATSMLAFQWMSQQVWLSKCPTPSISLCSLKCFRRFGLIRSLRSRAASWGGTRNTSLP